MPAVEVMTMSCKDRPADKAAVETAVKGRPAAEATAMKAAAMESTAMESTAVETAAVETAAAMTTSAMTTATDFDQPLGDVFRRQRCCARTCRRQRLGALHWRQQQHRRHAGRGGDQSPEFCTKPCGRI